MQVRPGRPRAPAAAAPGGAAERPLPGVLTPDASRRAARLEAILLDVDGVLTDGTFEPTGPSSKAPERKQFHARDGLGLVMASKLGLRLGFITGRRSGIVRDRAAELSLAFYRDGCLKKGPVFEEAGRELGLDPQQIAFIGDDVQDIPALRRAGFAAAPSDAHPAVLARVHFVAAAPGGRGAVREIVERILEARGELETALFDLWR